MKKVIITNLTFKILIELMKEMGIESYAKNGKIMFPFPNQSKIISADDNGIWALVVHTFKTGPDSMLQNNVELKNYKHVLHDHEKLKDVLREIANLD